MSLLVATDARGVATITLNRPERRNAFDDGVIADLAASFARLGADPAVRIVVLTGAGPAFCTGGDISWMRAMAQHSAQENLADARILAEMFRIINELPKPTVARINGAAFAGGAGLVACCDIAIAAESALFAISETRLGLVPATIGPYVVAAIGARAARRYFLTAETFSAAAAQNLGLVHLVTPDAALDQAVAKTVEALLAGGASAQARAKRLIAELDGRPITAAIIELTAEVIATARASEEGREGLAAFLEKRQPAWRR